MKIDQVAVRHKIQELLRSNGLSPAGLADESGLQHYTVMRILDGHRKPQAATLSRIAQAFGLTFGELVAVTPAARSPKIAKPPIERTAAVTPAARSPKIAKPPIERTAAVTPAARLPKRAKPPIERTIAQEGLRQKEVEIEQLRKTISVTKTELTAANRTLDRLRTQLVTLRARLDDTLAQLSRF